PARGERPDEDALVGVPAGHPDPVAEDRPAGERARGVDRDHGDAPALLAPAGDERVGERRLAAARRAGDAYHGGPAGAGAQEPQELGAALAALLDEGDHAGQRTLVARVGALQQLSVLRGGTLHPPRLPRSLS